MEANSWVAEAFLRGLVSSFFFFFLSICMSLQELTIFIYLVCHGDTFIASFSTRGHIFDAGVKTVQSCSTRTVKITGSEANSTSAILEGALFRCVNRLCTCCSFANVVFDTTWSLRVMCSTASFGIDPVNTAQLRRYQYLSINTMGASLNC